MLGPSFTRVSVLACSLLLACGSHSPSDADSPAVTATFSVTQVDTMRVPFVVGQDEGCQQVNTGGWITLEASGRYTLSLERIGRLCVDNTGGIGSTLPQEGTYTVTGDSIAFSPRPPYGPGFSAHLVGAPDRNGLITEGNLQFTFVAHRYFALTNPTF
jgi:hypothetical protein